MPLSTSSKRSRKNAPPGETGQEALYLRSLSEWQVPAVVKMRDGERVTGWIEYFDDRMVRLTREGLPNLFIYKSQIHTICEQRTAAGSSTGNRVAGKPVKRPSNLGGRPITEPGHPANPGGATKPIGDAGADDVR